MDNEKLKYNNYSGNQLQKQKSNYIILNTIYAAIFVENKKDIYLRNGKI